MLLSICVTLVSRFVGETTGPRTYYLVNELAQLEQSLVQYTISKLLERVRFVFLECVCFICLFHMSRESSPSESQRVFKDDD